MPDLLNAIQALERANVGVLRIRYSHRKTGCVVYILRDTPEVRQRVDAVMSRYNTRHTIQVATGSADHADTVDRLAAEARTALADRKPRTEHLPAHAHRQRKG